MPQLKAQLLLFLLKNSRRLVSLHLLLFKRRYKFKLLKVNSQFEKTGSKFECSWNSARIKEKWGVACGLKVGGSDMKPV